MIDIAKRIELPKSQYTLVDDEDYYKLSKYRWSTTRYGHVYRYENYKTITMHREIMNVKYSDMVVDHINGNPLDNTKANLRVCSHKDNIANQKLRSDNQSGFKGVGFLREKWRTRIKSNKKMVHLGYFEDINDAARMYNFWANDLYGEYARLNEINDKKWEVVAHG